jgi:hypothetical protein
VHRPVAAVQAVGKGWRGVDQQGDSFMQEAEFKVEYKKLGKWSQ